MAFDIDAFIDNIGELSWASRFEIGNPGEIGLSPELLAKQLVHFDPSLFRQIATEANIFRHNKADDILSWSDNLIADGCLAILLGRSLHNANNTKKILEFSGRLDGLKSQYSLNILSLVLDNDSIIKLARIVGQTNYDRIDLIDQILTDQVIEKLKKDIKGNKIGLLNQALIDSFSLNENPTSILKLARLVSKLCYADPQLREYLKQHLMYEDFRAKLAQYVFALDIKRPNDFYRMMDDHNVDWEESMSISIIANEYLDYKALYNRFEALSAKADIVKIVQTWRLYLDKKDTRYIINEIELMNNDQDLFEDDKNIRILDECLDVCKKKMSPKDELSVKFRIKKLADSSWQSKKYRFCAIYLQYLVYFETHDLFFKDRKWAVHKNEKYGIPIEPYNSAQIVRIKALIPQRREFGIATSVQITDRSRYSVELATNNGLELVSDGMPNNDIHQKQLPVNFQLVNFKAKPLYIERADMVDLQTNAERSFFWRPVYKFD